MQCLCSAPLFFYYTHSFIHSFTDFIRVFMLCHFILFCFFVAGWQDDGSSNTRCGFCATQFDRNRIFWLTFFGRRQSNGKYYWAAYYIHFEHKFVAFYSIISTCQSFEMSFNFNCFQFDPENRSLHLFLIIINWLISTGWIKRQEYHGN